MYPGLRYADKKLKTPKKKFLENVCLSTKFNLRLKKNGVNSILLQKNANRHQKNANHTFFIYGNCMITIFFSRNRNFVFFSSPDCFIWFKKP